MALQKDIPEHQEEDKIAAIPDLNLIALILHHEIKVQVDPAIHLPGLAQLKGQHHHDHLDQKVQQVEKETKQVL